MCRNHVGAGAVRTHDLPLTRRVSDRADTATSEAISVPKPPPRNVNRRVSSIGETAGTDSCRSRGHTTSQRATFVQPRVGSCRHGTGRVKHGIRLVMPFPALGCPSLPPPGRPPEPEVAGSNPAARARRDPHSQGVSASQETSFGCRFGVSSRVGRTRTCATASSIGTALRWRAPSRRWRSGARSRPRSGAAATAGGERPSWIRRLAPECRPSYGLASTPAAAERPGRPGAKARHDAVGVCPWPRESPRLWPGKSPHPPDLIT